MPPRGRTPVRYAGGGVGGGGGWAAKRGGWAASSWRLGPAKPYRHRLGGHGGGGGAAHHDVKVNKAGVHGVVVDADDDSSYCSSPWTLPPGRRLAPRLDGWAILATSSVIALRGVSAARTGAVRSGVGFAPAQDAALAAIAIGTAVSAAVAVGMRYAPLRTILTEASSLPGLTCELAVLSLLAAMWAVAVSIVADGGSDDAPLGVDGTDIWNANLYYSSCVSFLICIYLWVEVLTLPDRRGALDGPRQPQKNNIFTKRWTLLFLNSLILMSACILTYTSPSCEGPILTQSSYCSRTLLGILLGGVLQSAIALGVSTLYRLSSIRPGVLDEQLRNWLTGLAALTSLVVQAVNVALLTSPTGGGPGNISGSLYFGSWLAFALAFELCLRYLDLYSTGGIDGSPKGSTRKRRRSRSPMEDTVTTYEDEDVVEEQRLRMLRANGNFRKEMESQQSETLTAKSREEEIQHSQSFVFSYSAKPKPLPESPLLSTSPQSRIYQLFSNHHYGGGIEPDKSMEEPKVRAADRREPSRSPRSSRSPTGRPSRSPRSSRSPPGRRKSPDPTGADGKVDPIKAGRRTRRRAVPAVERPSNRHYNKINEHSEGSRNGDHFHAAVVPRFYVKKRRASPLNPDRPAPNKSQADFRSKRRESLEDFVVASPPVHSRPMPAQSSAEQISRISLMRRHSKSSSKSNGPMKIGSKKEGGQVQPQQQQDAGDRDAQRLMPVSTSGSIGMVSMPGVMGAHNSEARGASAPPPGTRATASGQIPRDPMQSSASRKTAISFGQNSKRSAGAGSSLVAPAMGIKRKPSIGGGSLGIGGSSNGNAPHGGKASGPSIPADYTRTAAHSSAPVSVDRWASAQSKDPPGGGAAKRTTNSWPITSTIPGRGQSSSRGVFSISSVPTSGGESRPRPPPIASSSAKDDLTGASETSSKKRRPPPPQFHRPPRSHSSSEPSLDTHKGSSMSEDTIVSVLTMDASNSGISTTSAILTEDGDPELNPVITFPSAKENVTGFSGLPPKKGRPPPPPFHLSPASQNAPVQSINAGEYSSDHMISDPTLDPGLERPGKLESIPPPPPRSKKMDDGLMRHDSMSTSSDALTYSGESEPRSSTSNESLTSMKASENDGVNNIIAMALAHAEKTFVESVVGVSDGMPSQTGPTRASKLKKVQRRPGGRSPSTQHASNSASVENLVGKALHRALDEYDGMQRPQQRQKGAPPRSSGLQHSKHSASSEQVQSQLCESVRSMYSQDETETSRGAFSMHYEC